MAQPLAATPSRSTDAGTTTDQPVVPDRATGIDPIAATELLASVGFLLVPGSPFDRDPAYLLVALRPRPTLAHFDPERIDLWTMEGANSGPVSLSWPMADRVEAYQWGTIRIVDRVSATNRFVSFGGQLTVSHDREMQAALFRSDAPILAIGGHSGPADPLGPQVADFFAVLRAAAGDREVAQVVGGLSPVALYAAFVERTLAEPERVKQTRSPQLASLIRSEHNRLERDRPAEAHAGADLARLL